MPTTLQRSQVTHTPPIQRALDIASDEWPQDAARPAALLANLVLRGAEAVEADRAERRKEREALVRARAGRFTGVYGPGYLEELREGWPQ